jgi:glucose/arabinose dehydrogenase
LALAAALTALPHGARADVGSLLTRVQLPPGFKIAVYADQLENARSMALSPNGTLFIGTRSANYVYAVRDTDGDNRADETYTILAPGKLPDGSDVWMPNGVAFRDGSLYVATVNQILRFDNIESRLDRPPAPVIVTADYPARGHHGWKFIAFGPDGKLYVPVGAPCNDCESSEEIFATITRIKPDGTGREIIARGVRNTVGFDWHPVTRELWFTDNGRDLMGDDVPGDELNRLAAPGLHFGFPYVHEDGTLDPIHGRGRNAADFEPPVQVLVPHVAALGMRFYTGSMFPETYRNQIFIAEHGSWNRREKSGYRITLVRLDGNRAVSYEPFATGWLSGQQNWGRPADVLVMPDGSMLVSDDQIGAIYRITYGGA